MVLRVAKVEISKFTLYDMLILIRSPNLRAIFMLIEDNISIIGNHIHLSPIWEIIIYCCPSNFQLYKPSRAKFDFENCGYNYFPN